MSDAAFSLLRATSVASLRRKLPRGAAGKPNDQDGRAEGDSLSWLGRLLRLWSPTVAGGGDLFHSSLDQLA